MSHLGDRLTAFVDGELDHRTRELVAGHLTRCERCRAEAAAERQVKALLGGLTADVPTAEPSARLHERLLALAAPGQLEQLPPLAEQPGTPVLAAAGRTPIAPSSGARSLRRAAGRVRGLRPGMPADLRPGMPAGRRPGETVRAVAPRRSGVLAAGVLAVLGVGGSLLAGGQPGGPSTSVQVVSPGPQQASLLGHDNRSTLLPLHAPGASFVSTVSTTSGLLPSGH